MIHPGGFDLIRVTHIGQLTIVTGVVGIAWGGTTDDDFARDDLEFLIPSNGNGDPLRVNPGSQMSAIVFPATAIAGGFPLGWGVDNFEVYPEGDFARIKARVVVAGTHSKFFRVGFQAIIG